MRPNWAQGKDNYTPKGKEFLQIYGSHVKSETLDSCRFETKMRQNAPNLISVSILFPGVTPGPPPLGALPPDPRGEEGGRVGKGRGSLRHCRWGIDVPAFVYNGPKGMELAPNPHYSGGS